MCGIIGYVGEKDAVPILVNGLKRLEYRGYDSAGLAAIKGNGAGDEVMLIRAAGRVANLETKWKSLALDGCPAATVGIAHTRWATHGAPEEKNAHPHADCRNEIFVVHNGIIENYAELKKTLLHEGHRFSSDTDTEVLAHLIERHYAGGADGQTLFQALPRALEDVRGTYAIAAIAVREPRTIVCARRASPLLIGIGEREHLIASDASALLGRAKNVIYLEDGEVAEIGAGHVAIKTHEGSRVERRPEPLAITLEAAEKHGHPHFMHKEICEAPEAIIAALREARAIRAAARRSLQGMERIQIVACGTAAHAGHAGKYLFETYAGIPSAVDIGSEFRYRRAPSANGDTLAIAISQSGETADTLAALREARRQGARTLAIVNTVGSTIAREADAVIYQHAGPEISVASTKAFISQLAVLALATGDRRLEGTLKDLPAHIHAVLAGQEPVVKAIAERYAQAEHLFFLGRGAHFPIALEGALKLKEVAYLHAEACPAGEFKHGPLAMIDDRTPSFFIIPRDAAYEKNRSNLEEVHARRGPIIALTTEGGSAEELRAWTSDIITIPFCHEALLPILAAIPVYLFAYYAALARGCDVDKPRNLAKSVTVE